jgi:hypothetical protein
MIALPAFVLRAIEHHLQDYVAAPADSFVFTRSTGLPLRRQDLSHAWTAACAVVGIEGVRPHDLRHHATTVIERNPNVTLRKLMATIGHSSHMTALRYQHATAERSKEIADYLDGVITAATTPNRPSPSASVPDGCGMGVAWTRRRETRDRRIVPLSRDNTLRRRAESNRRTGLCRPLPKPLGHAAASSHERAASLTACVPRPRPRPQVGPGRTVPSAETETRARIRLR